MKRLLATVFLAAALLVSAYGQDISSRQLDEALQSLDRSLRRSDGYIARRQTYIDSMTALPGAARRPDLLLRIADAYTSFNTDSALHYLDLGIAQTSGRAQLPFRWRRAKLLPLAGFFDRGETEFARIHPDSIPPEMLASYLDAGRQMHSYIASFYHNYPTVYKVHADSVRAFQRRLLQVLPPESVEYKFNQAEYYFENGRQALAKVLFENLLSQLPPTDNLRARATHHLAKIAENDRNRNAYLYYLALSARTDVEAATRETLSLQELGRQLSDEDIGRGYNYMYSALQNAVDGGVTMRTVDMSLALPVIERAHTESLHRSRNFVYGVLAVMTVLILVLVGMLVFLRYEILKMRRLQQSLRQANHAKEIYISQFLQLCSVYMDKLNQFSKTVTRKLAAGQADELYRLTKSGKFVDEQSRDFYEVFDNAFLHIYPNFVAEVNRLLRPDAQIEIREGERLNTDLRILAFMRLGIEESSRIAQVLNYSLNTIYAYRNRLKARAISRDTFEEDISRIESVL